MTERERRALGLPPSPAQVALAESIQGMAERQIGPAVAEITRLGRVVAETMRPTMELAKHLHESQQMTVPVPVRDSGPKLVRLDETQLDTLLEKLAARSVAQTAPNEIIYSWKKREFSRIVLGQEISSSFSDQKDDNKRRRLVEKLLRTQDYVRTKTLTGIFGCTTKEIGNIVAAINIRFGVELTLQNKLIDSKRGKGYRINRGAYVVYQKK